MLGNHALVRRLPKARGDQLHAALPTAKPNAYVFPDFWYQQAGIVIAWHDVNPVLTPAREISQHLQFPRVGLADTPRKIGKLRYRATCIGRTAGARDIRRRLPQLKEVANDD
ncbi:hypothetical protein D3C78_1573850 [compost metagenome]